MLLRQINVFLQIDLRSQVGLCIVVIPRLLWATCPLISKKGQLLRRNHSLDSPGYSHNPMRQLSILVSCLVRVREKMIGALLRFVF